MATDEFRKHLENFISEQAGTPAVIDKLEPIAGGTSRDSWLVIVTQGDKQEKWVLRRDPAAPLYDLALERDEEFALLQAAHNKGVLVPRPHWYSSDLGAPFFLMDYVEGVSIGRQIVQIPELAQARQNLPEQMAEQLARIHTIDYAALEFLPHPREDMTPARELIAQVRETLTSLSIQNPAIEFGLRWAEQTAPVSAELVLLHGDFRIGNLIVGPDRLNAVIDWEFSHLGDPLEELAYPCLRDWRFGKGHLHLGGISPREPFIAAYERHSGRTVDRQAVDWWEIAGNLRWAVVCLAQANRHLSGSDLSVEFASLGRRSAEIQLEMLRLIEQQGI